MSSKLKFANIPNKKKENTLRAKHKIKVENIYKLNSRTFLINKKDNSPQIKNNIKRLTPNSTYITRTIENLNYIPKKKNIKISQKNSITKNQSINSSRIRVISKEDEIILQSKPIEKNLHPYQNNNNFNINKINNDSVKNICSNLKYKSNTHKSNKIKNINSNGNLNTYIDINMNFNSINYFPHKNLLNKTQIKENPLLFLKQPVSPMALEMEKFKEMKKIESKNIEKKIKMKKKKKFSTNQLNNNMNDIDFDRDFCQTEVSKLSERNKINDQNNRVIKYKKNNKTIEIDENSNNNNCIYQVNNITSEKYNTLFNENNNNIINNKINYIPSKKINGNINMYDYIIVRNINENYNMDTISSCLRNNTNFEDKYKNTIIKPIKKIEKKLTMNKKKNFLSKKPKQNSQNSKRFSKMLDKKRSQLKQSKTSNLSSIEVKSEKLKEKNNSNLTISNDKEDKTSLNQSNKKILYNINDNNIIKNKNNDGEINNINDINENNSGDKNLDTSQTVAPQISNDFLYKNKIERTKKNKIDNKNQNNLSTNLNKSQLNNNNSINEDKMKINSVNLSNLNIFINQSLNEKVRLKENLGEYSKSKPISLDYRNKIINDKLMILFRIIYKNIILNINYFFNLNKKLFKNEEEKNEKKINNK